MKIYLYILRALIVLGIIVLFTLAWLFSSPSATKRVVDAINNYTQIQIESAQGSLQNGLSIANLTHPDFSLEYGQLSLNWLALLHGKIHLNELTIEGLHVNESLLNSENSDKDSSNLQIPFEAFQIDVLHVNLKDLKYEKYILKSLILEGEKLYYSPKKAPKGEIFIDLQSSLGNLKANANLGNIISATGNFAPKELPNGLRLQDPIIFEANGDTQEVHFDLQTVKIGYETLKLPIFIQTPQISGSYHFKTQSLRANLQSSLDFAKAKVLLDGDLNIDNNDLKTLRFNINGESFLSNKTLEILSKNFELPILETFSFNEASTFKLNGNQNKINYTLQIPHFTTNEALLLQSKIEGFATLNSLQGKLATNLEAANIPTAIEGEFEMQDFNIDTFNFSIQAQSNLKEYIDSTLFSQVKGNLNRVDFTTTLKPVRYNEINIDELTIDGMATQKGLNFNLQSAFKTNKESLHVKIQDANLSYDNTPITLNFNPQIKLNNEPLIFIEEPHLSLAYNPQSLHIKLYSKYVDINSTYDLQSAIAGSLHVKPFEPSLFVSLPDSIILNSVQAKGDFSYNKSIQANMQLFLDKTPFQIKAQGEMQDLKFSLINPSFKIDAQNRNNRLIASANIQNLSALLKSIQPHFSQELPPIKGSLKMQAFQKDGVIEFNGNSPTISYQDQSLHNVTLNGNFKDTLLTLDKFNFSFDSGFGLDSNSSFFLTNPATFDTNTTNLNLDFKGLSIEATFKPQISLNLNANDFFLSHPLYGRGIASGALHVSQKGEDIYIGGEMNAKDVKSHYKPSGFSVHTDKDIIIVDHNQSEKEDFFTQNIGLDLAIIVDDVHYKQDEIDLKTSGIFYLKKEPAKLLEFYGSILDITGNVVTLGKKFDISASNLYFRGYNPIDPVLDIVALYKHQETDITIKITGTQSNPRVYLSSNPLMSQRDIFSILVFGTRFGDSKNPHSQQNRTTQASLFLVNELSKDYVKALGLDILMFEYNPNSGTIETTIGKEITDETTIMLKNESDGGSAILQQELSPRWKIELGVGSESQSIDIIHKKKY